jgi:[CysO sulfur-carrier protein]-S-L-cysteine hydrolase
MATPTKERLVIPAEIYDAMLAHCTRAPARTSCGILGGIPPRVSAIYPLVNIAVNVHRYEADHDNLIRAAVDMRKRGLTIAAIYHSSPSRPAVPTQTDLDENYYGEIPRVIVSLGKVVFVRVWQLNAQRFVELDWRVLPREKGLRPKNDFGWPADEQIAAVVESRSAFTSIFTRAARWLRPSSGGPIGDSPNGGPDPMWDPSLDGG